jgi:hypothetical protein
VGLDEPYQYDISFGAGQEFGIRYDEEQVVSMLIVEEIIDATKGMLG